jgi:Uma2 family endonuclease
MPTLWSTSRPQRLVLYGVSWAQYTRMLRAFASRAGYRLTYDRETLEIMSPLFEHEIDVDLLARFVVVLTAESGLPIQAGRSTTHRRRKMRRGLEADHSWWIAHAPPMRGKRKLDLRVDPPPDLAIPGDRGGCNPSVDQAHADLCNSASSRGLASHRGQSNVQRATA